MEIRIVVSGRSYHAAEEIPQQVTLPDGSSVDEALKVIAEQIPEGKGLPDSCLRTRIHCTGSQYK